MRKLKVILVGMSVAGAVLVVPGTGALATTPAPVHIEVTTALPPAGLSFGPFTASGSAVDAGVICASGTTIDAAPAKAQGFESGHGVTLQVTKRFTCDDHSGDFLIKLQVHFDWKGLNFNWNVVGGTGAYAGLHGTGSGVGLPCTPDCVFDVYDGAMH